jgi:Amiloride-sensitive sodium channel
VKVCGISDIKCYQAVIQQSVERSLNKSQTSECNCLPTCTSISYDADVNYVTISENYLIKIFGNYNVEVFR